MPFDMKVMGARLKTLRQIYEIKQDEVARGLGLKQSAVSSHEAGTSSPNAAAIVWYAERYNVSADYLLGLTDDPRPSKKAVPGAERSYLGDVNLLLSATADPPKSQPIEAAISEILPGILQKILPDLLPSALAQYVLNSGKHEPKSEDAPPADQP